MIVISKFNNSNIHFIFNFFFFRLNFTAAFNASAEKGNQMLPGGSKTRTGLQAGYFHDKFNRVMEGESYSDPIKMRRQHRIKESQKNIGKPFLPSSGDKKSLVHITINYITI